MANRKDIHLSISPDARTAEMLDELRALQGISHAGAVRRAIHLLSAQCGIGSCNTRMVVLHPIEHRR